MSKISLLIDTGKRAMMNNQTALQTVGHNIANKSTEGYSRQRVELQANVPFSVGRLQIGTGSRASQVTRINNPYLEKQIQKETSNSGFMDARAEALASVEQIYNEQVNKGLSQNMSEFFNAFRELANTPESIATRTFVRDAGQILASDFQRVNSNLVGAQQDLNMQIKTHVVEINQMVKEIANLNEKIAAVEMQGIPDNDERDRRDLLLKKLNEKIDITCSESDNGQVTIVAGRNAILVSGFTALELDTHPSANGDILDVVFKTTAGEAVPLTKTITGGKLGALIEVRDKTIEEFKERVDTLAHTLTSEVNRVHSQGVDLVGRPGLGFFEDPKDVKGAAATMSVNAALKKDVNRVVTGIKEKGVADNTVANVITKLQSLPILNDGTATLDDYYRASISQVGVLAARAKNESESQKNILTQLSNLRESISGVSLDEEATKMIEFQRSFDASARIVRTADEMFNTILGLKPM
ncbi:MAG: hypothetical protein RJB66_1078 [Pseudomonadota bacterium]|jgi:flagellar hook-associated protein 1 FlgK